MQKTSNFNAPGRPAGSQFTGQYGGTAQPQQQYDRGGRGAYGGLQQSRGGMGGGQGMGMGARGQCCIALGMLRP